MKKRYLIIFILQFLFFTIKVNAQSTSITLKDIKMMTGEWKGALTYLDYSTNKPFTMPADLTINYLNKIKSVVFSNSYPKEPHANSIDTIALLQKGKVFGKEIVKSNTRFKNGNILIITEEAGTDGNDNKPAIFKHIYTVGKNIFINKKEVKLNDSDNWIMRHQYQYRRV